MKLTSEEQATTEMQWRVAIVDGCTTTSRAMYYQIERDWDNDARHGDGTRCSALSHIAKAYVEAAHDEAISWNRRW